jgi:hypothetical protein
MTGYGKTVADVRLTRAEADAELAEEPGVGWVGLRRQEQSLADEDEVARGHRLAVARFLG